MAQEILAGTMTVQQYLTSRRGTTVFAAFSPNDPMPLIAEPLLLRLDRLNGRTSKRQHGLPPPRLASRRKNGIDSVMQMGEYLKLISADAGDKGQRI